MLSYRDLGRRGDIGPGGHCPGLVEQGISAMRHITRKINEVIAQWLANLKTAPHEDPDLASETSATNDASPDWRSFSQKYTNPNWPDRDVNGTQVSQDPQKR